MNGEKGRLYNYEIVRAVLLNNQDEYLRPSQIAHLSRIQLSEIYKILGAAYKLGWVTRIECGYISPPPSSSIPSPKYPKRTAYKIKRTESWMGMRGLHSSIFKTRGSRKSADYT